MQAHAGIGENGGWLEFRLVIFPSPDTHNAHGGAENQECIVLSCNDLHQLVSLRHSIQFLASIWHHLAVVTGKNEFTEEDAKKMAELRANDDQSNNLNLVFTAIAQSVTPHAGFAMQYKRGLDVLSAEIAKATYLFEGDANPCGGFNDE